MRLQGGQKTVQRFCLSDMRKRCPEARGHLLRDQSCVGQIKHAMQGAVWYSVLVNLLL